MNLICDAVLTHTQELDMVCMFEDITKLHNKDGRKCTVHGTCCASASNLFHTFETSHMVLLESRR